MSTAEHLHCTAIKPGRAAKGSLVVEIIGNKGVRVSIRNTTSSFFLLPFTLPLSPPGRIIQNGL